MQVSPKEIDGLLKTAHNLQIIGLSQQTCHRFITPTSSSNTSSSTIATTSEPTETAAVYSKKARILDASSKSELIIEPPNPPPPCSPAPSYDEQEQDSPLVSSVY